MSHQTAQLGTLCTITKGKSPITKTPPGPYPLVTTGEERKSAASYQFDGEAVCVPLVSSTGHGHASLKRVHYQSGKFALANILAALQVRDASILSTRYLAVYLMHFKDQLIVPLMTGSANMSLSIERLAKVEISFPPLPEQERIVRLLDEADAIRMLRAEAYQRTADLIPALFQEMFGDPAANPMGWPEVPLGEVTEVVRGLTFKPVDKLASDAPDAIVCFRTKNIQESLYLGDLIYIPRQLVKSERSLVHKGDVLISMANSLNLVGKVCTVPDLAFDTTLGGFIAAVRVQDDEILHPTYLYNWLNSALVQEQLRRLARQTTNIANLPMKEVAKLLIPLPSIDRQSEFSATLTKIQAVRSQQEHSQNNIADTVSGLLSRAFV